MGLEELKKRLRSYGKDKIRLSDHAFYQGFYRRVDEELVIAHLKNPDSLIDSRKEKALYPGEEKYTLFFRMEENRTLIVVAALGRYLRVVTIIVRYRKHRFKGWGN